MKHQKEKKATSLYPVAETHHNLQDAVIPPSLPPPTLSVVMKGLWGLRAIKRKASQRNDDSRFPVQRTSYPRKSSCFTMLLLGLTFFFILFFFWRHSSRPEGGVEKSKLLRKRQKMTILQRSLKIRSQFSNPHRSSPTAESSSSGGGLVACYACVCTSSGDGIQVVGKVDRVRVATDESFVGSAVDRQRQRS